MCQMLVLLPRVSLRTSLKQDTIMNLVMSIIK